MNFKININKISSDLSNKFDSVEISEKSNQKYGNYIELIIRDNNKKLFSIIEKKKLDNYNFEWIYKSNPLLENSSFVERKSNVSNFCDVVEDIFNKKRFDSDYLTEINKNKNK